MDIDFLDDEKRRDETSFNVKNVLSKSGQSELSILFDDGTPGTINEVPGEWEPLN